MQEVSTWKHVCLPQVPGKNGRALTLVAALLLITVGAAVRRSAAQEQHRAKMQQNLNWRYYGNDAGNMRYQNVDQINTTNVSQLKPAWVFYTGVHDKQASMETTPIVLDGVMYLTSGDDDVFAVNAGTGTQIWAYHPTDMPPLSKLPLCCARNNRGVAQGQGRLYLARLDATLVAVDQGTGQQLWKTTVDDWHNGYTMTIPPQFVNGMVIVGVSGGEYFIRGHVDAYNATTGSLVWRFYTTDPATFAGDSYLQGGGPVWQNPSFDLGLGMLYFSVGKAGPDINGVPRAGTNLYTTCVVALDIATGTLRWYFQESHHDLWDYDATPPTMLFTLNGTPAIAHVGKTGYLFILDRRTGTLTTSWKPRFQPSPRGRIPGPRSQFQQSNHLLPTRWDHCLPGTLAHRSGRPHRKPRMPSSQATVGGRNGRRVRTAHARTSSITTPAMPRPLSTPRLPTYRAAPTRVGGHYRRRPRGRIWTLWGA